MVYKSIQYISCWGMICSLMKPSREHLLSDDNYFLLCSVVIGFPSDSEIQNLPANAGDTISIPGSGRCPEKEMAPNPLFLLGNPIDRGAWQVTVNRVTKSQTQRLNDSIVTNRTSSASVIAHCIYSFFPSDQRKLIL